MKVRAVAVGDERANAVGTLELESTPLGLVMIHRGVGAFSRGYAPAALTHGTRVTVPWASIGEARVEADRLWLSIDPTLTPHNRLLLAAFSTGDPPDPAESAARRRLVRMAAGGMAVIALVLVVVTLPQLTPRAGGAGALALGVLLAAAVLGVGFAAERRVDGPRLAPRAILLAFVAQLAPYLPQLSVTPQRRRASTTDEALPALDALLPRSTTAIVIVLTACTLGAALTATWVIAPRPTPRTAYAPAPKLTPWDAPRRSALAGAQGGVDSTSAGPVGAAPSPASNDEGRAPTRATAGAVPDVSPPPEPARACQCNRGASVLWQQPIPRIGTVLIERRERHRKKGVYLELELGLVNNSDTPIEDVNLLVRFFDRDPPPSRKLYFTKDRPLYFAGPLAPGQAIKWHVEARGTDFEVHHDFEGDIGARGEHAAPTNLIAELLEANHRPIRLHAAMLLAFLEDPRGKQGALLLKEALREDEAPYLDRVIRAVSELKVCDLRMGDAGEQRPFSACVFNSGATPRDNLALRLRALDRPFPSDTPTAHPPLVVANSTVPLGTTVGPGAGIAVDGSFDVRNHDGITPQAFEGFVDREDLLPP